MLHKIKHVLQWLYFKLIKGGQRLRKSLIIPEFYDSIHTLTQLRWHNFNETGDPKSLLKKGGNWWLIDIEAAKENLQREFFEAFGVSDKYKEWYKANAEYHILMAESINKNDRTFRTMAAVAKTEADSLLKDFQGGSLKEAAAATGLDPATTSVFMFNSRLEMLSNG